MNRRQKEVQEALLKNEKNVLEKLKVNYSEALEEIEEKIAKLKGRDDANLQHVIYQVEYQQMLKKQVEGILSNLTDKNFESISQYLTESYEDGFIGTLYDIQGQGVPFIFPIDQKQVVEAIQHETKLSSRLYMKLGKDVNVLSKQIAAEISRGISTAAMYPEIARNVSNRCGISMNNSMRIARTEGHRIQCKATMDVQRKAKEKGADVVKQWDSTLDGKTRESHRAVDGELRELDEPFSNGLMYPGDPEGPACEVVQCRCALLQRARWALKNGFTKMDNESKEIKEFKDVKDYENFKKQYKGLAAKIGSDTIPEHEEPVLLGTIDFNDKKAIINELEKYEKTTDGDKIETACVITKSGKIYKCFGISNRVFPDYDLKDELNGACVSHYHPEEETEYSFSDSDRILFCEYNLELLRGHDNMYVYELSNSQDKVDEMPEDWQTMENFRHSIMIRDALKYGIGYKRWKK